MKHSASDAEMDIVSTALALGADRVGGPLSLREEALLMAARERPAAAASREQIALRRQIKDGLDPLGAELCGLRTQAKRRALGSFYTDPSIVKAMMQWVSKQEPDEVVDCGAGSGRFATAAARMPGIKSVLAVDLDPVACIIARANCAVLELPNVRVLNDDFTVLHLPDFAGRRAFIGNPPYVRHHSLTAEQKERARGVAASLGIHLSGLAGLHAHFVIAAAALARSGDVLCFITSSEWLDVNYGRGLRDLMVDGLRAEEIHLLDASATAFADATTTAVIICARAGGEAEHVRFKTAASLRGMLRLGQGGRLVPRADLQLSKRWGRIARNRYNEMDQTDSLPLGSIARVHRGTVTGANDYFVMTRPKAADLGLARCVRPVLTSAEEILSSPGIVRDTPGRKVLLVPPDDLDDDSKRALDRYIQAGEERGLHERYVAAHRTPWWKPHVLAPPPVIATYMARQAPAFALNPDGLLILNVLHGLYPLTPLDGEQLRLLVETLTGLRDTYRGHGRTYQGGLEKFEPREMERLMLPLPSPGKLALLCDG